MKFCSSCGQPVARSIPAGDHLPRHVCSSCGVVHYENPKLIVGCVPEWQGKVLLCKRAIEPRLGFWTFPAGFMENGETLQQAAARESLEEALARVRVDSLLAIVHVVHVVVHAHQVLVMFRGTLLDPNVGAGTESLEVGLYAEHEIPWQDIAFRSIEFALRRYFEDRRSGGTGMHFHDI
jgi:ADP-ribose pyrophosphatase YjhB (NUDIX family)